MSALCPYEALEVIATSGKVNGRQWWVRDADETWFHLVEYVGHPGRLTCWCDDGFAHAESPGTEPECAHLRAVIELCTATSPRTPAPINVGSFVE